jgi:transcriptional regulator with XRE-family HTH domain
MSPDEVEKVVGSMVSIHDDLCAEVGRYERFKRGDLSDCKILREVGPLLIAARLARGLTQRDLAEKLGVHESQVSRDEKNEYQGISLERAVQVLEVLSVDVEIRPSLRPGSEVEWGGKYGGSRRVSRISTIGRDCRRGMPQVP